MSASNRSEQEEARAAAARQGISYVAALAKVRRSRAVQMEDRDTLVKELARLLHDVSPADRLWIFRYARARQNIASGELHTLSTEALADAVSVAEMLLDDSRDRTVTLAPSLIEQFDAALARGRVTSDCRVKLDASQVLRSAGVTVYVRWDEGHSLEVHMEEIGRVDADEGMLRVDPVRQYKEAGLEALIDHAQAALRAGKASLLLSDTPELESVLLAAGWTDEDAGHPPSILSDGELRKRWATLVRRISSPSHVWT